MRNLTLRQVRTFISVAEHLHFHRAAQALNLTAAAVSLQIKQLEDDIGMPLFARKGKHISLTTAGEYMLVYAQRMMSVLREARDVFSRINHIEGGRLTVGLVGTAKYFVPHILSTFRAEHPKIEISLFLSNREGLLKALQEHKVDLAIVGGPPRELSVLAEPFALHPLVLVAAPSHPLAQRGKLPVSALEGEDFIIREIGSGCRHAVEQFLSVHSVNPHITMEIPNNETIKQAVIAGMGMSIMSLHTIGLELRNNLLTIVDMEDLPIMRTWHVVHLQSKVLSLAAEALRHYLLEQGEAYFVNDAVFSQYTFAEHSAQLIETAKNLTLSTMN